MPVPPARMALTHNLLATMEDTLNDPTDVAKKLAFDDALEALLAAERTDATARATTSIAAAINAYDKERRRGILIRLGVTFAAVIVVPLALIAGYHFTVGPGAIASRVAALETKTSLLVTTTTQGDELFHRHKGEIDALGERLDEQKKWIRAMWPDHDLDSDNVVDRIDICRGTERGVEVFLSGPVHGCSTNQAAWLCTDLPAVPAADMTFSWDMTACPAGMLKPGERVTCTFAVKPDRSGLATNDNCQIH